MDREAAAALAKQIKDNNFLKLLEAFAAGSTIQYRMLNSDDPVFRVWRDAGDPRWLFHCYEYRIKCSPVYRPYNKDELRDLFGETLIEKASGSPYLVTHVGLASCTVLLGVMQHTGRQLLDHFTHTCGKPCGVLCE